MCWANKCCLCVKIDLGCYILGISNFILSASIFVGSIVLLITGIKDDEKTPLESDKLSHLVKFIQNKTTLIVLIRTTVFFTFISMLASILLVVGVKKGKAGLVLLYFAFGVVLTIVCLLGALLALVHGHWVTSLVIFIVSMLYIHFLVVVNTLYHGLQKGKEFGFSPHRQLDEEELISE